MSTRANGLSRGFAHRLLPYLLCAFWLGPALAADSGSEVIARLGTTDITLAQLRDFFRALDPSVRQEASGDPQVLSRLVHLEITRMAVLRAAKSENWDQKPDVAAEIVHAREQVIVATYLGSHTAPPADFPSEAQVQSAYDANRDAFLMPRQYKLQQLFIGVPAGSDKAAEDAAARKAQMLAKEARAKGADFVALERANSDSTDDTGRQLDGNWIPENRLVSEIRTRVAGMSDGEISDPIRADDGWHIVRMIDTKPAGPSPLADVKDKIVAALRQHQQQENEQAYIKVLLEKTPVAVNEIGLKKILDPSP